MQEKIDFGTQNAKEQLSSQEAFGAATEGEQTCPPGEDAAEDTMPDAASQKTDRKTAVKRKMRATLRKVCVCGMMIALSVILCNLLGFSPPGLVRMELGFLPIAVVGIMFGWGWSAVCYGMADFIGGSIFFPGQFNIFITLNKILIGALMGLGFHGRKKIGVVRILITFALISVLLSFGMMALIFHFQFGNPWSVVLPTRAVNAGCTFVLRVVTMLLVDTRLTALLKREGDKINA